VSRFHVSKLIRCAQLTGRLRTLAAPCLCGHTVRSSYGSQPLYVSGKKCMEQLHVDSHCNSDSRHVDLFTIQPPDRLSMSKRLATKSRYMNLFHEQYGNMHRCLCLPSSERRAHHVSFASVSFQFWGQISSVGGN
jgi:hypothetical protein